MESNIRHFPRVANNKIRGIMENKKQKIILKIDGKKVPLNEFVESAFISTIKGFISSLKGAKAKKEIKIEINI